MKKTVNSRIKNANNCCCGRRRQPVSSQVKPVLWEVTMKLYEVSGPSWEHESTFFPTKSEAIKYAIENGDPETDWVNEIEIGKLTKAAACRLATGTGYAKSQRQIWPIERKPGFCRV